VAFLLCSYVFMFFLSLFVNNYQENILGIISAGVADSSFGFHCDEAIVQFVAAGCIFLFK